MAVLKFLTNARNRQPERSYKYTKTVFFKEDSLFNPIQNLKQKKVSYLSDIISHLRPRVSLGLIH